MQRKSLRLNPIAFIGAWIVVMIILTPIVMWVSGMGTAGGEQQPLTMLFTMLSATIIGAAVIAVSIPFFFRNWFKQNRIAALLLITTTVIAATSSILGNQYASDSYSFRETTDSLNGYELVKKVEYYNMKSEQVRSVGYLKNGQKDSIWITYDKKGRILEQKLYKDGVLIGQ